MEDAGAPPPAAAPAEEDSNKVSEPENPQCYPVVFPAYFSPFFPVSAPYWTGYAAAAAEEEEDEETHEIVRPTAVHSKAPINVEELVGISKLSLAEAAPPPPSSLSLKLLRGSDRQSAFHVSSSPAGSSVNSANPIRIRAV